MRKLELDDEELEATRNKRCKFCNSKEYTIRISVDKWIAEEKKFVPENNYEVDYCPMCGRKLV